MAKGKAKNTDKKKKNIKEIEIEEVEEIEEFDDEEFDFEEEEEVVTKKVIDDEFEDEDFEPLTLEERVISIEKKLNVTLVFIIIAALFSLLAFVANLTGGAGTYSSSGSEAEEETALEAGSGSYDTSAFTKVKAQELEKLSKGKKIIVWIGRQGCGYCTTYAPIITQIGKDFKETIYYIDLADIFDFSSGEQVTLLDEEAYDILMNFATDKDNEDVMEEFGATPMTLIIKNNKIIGSFTGAADAVTVADKLEDEGFESSK